MRLDTFAARHSRVGVFWKSQIGKLCLWQRTRKQKAWSPRDVESLILCVFWHRTCQTGTDIPFATTDFCRHVHEAECKLPCSHCSANPQNLGPTA